MTSEQLLRCQTCLNRKHETPEQPDQICNLRGHRLEPGEVCRYFDRDKMILEPQDHFTESDFITRYGNPRPNGQRAQWAMILVGIVMACYVLTLYSSYLQMELLQDFLDDVYVSDYAIDSNDRRQQSFGILFFVAFVISAVFFIRWFRRAYFNLWMRTGRTDLSEGWAAGGWFVPIISFFRPFQIMKEMHDGTLRLLEQQGERHVSTTPWYVPWWLLWVTTNILTSVVTRFVGNSETVEGLMLLTQWEIGINIADLILCVVTLIMIKDYKEKEELLEKVEMRRKI